MLLEVRIYTTKPGKRDEFVDWFNAKVVPLMEAKGMTIRGQFTSVEDENTFIWLRSFADQAERDRISNAFYGSSAWKDGLMQQARELVERTDVKVVQPIPQSAML